VWRAILNSFLTGILVSISQIYVIVRLSMNFLSLNGQDWGLSGQKYGMTA
jgi:hypothetical protein